MQVARGRHPAALEGELAPCQSRWLWLVWRLFGIRHAIVFGFSRVAFSLLADTSRIST